MVYEAHTVSFPPTRNNLNMVLIKLNVNSYVAWYTLLTAQNYSALQCGEWVF